ncbi:MAG: hypothetical protein GXY91_06395 [Clostridia bacterium]|nr:hypothetical protein [Clostridia bacterium]
MWIANILGGLIALLIGLIIRIFKVSGLIAGYNTAPNLSWILFTLVIVGGVLYLNTGERFKKKQVTDKTNT